MISLWLLTPASAASQVVTFCVEVDTAYTWMISSGDYWTTNQVRPHRGIRIGVFGGGGIDMRYAEDQGPRAGCASFILDDSQQYSVFAFSESQVDDRRLSAWESDGAGGLRKRATILASGFVPDGTPNQTVTTTLPHDLLHGALLAAGFVFYRYDYGTPTSFEYKLDVSDCCYFDWEWIRAGDPRLVRVVHEVGHAIGYARDESRSPRQNYHAPVDGCDAHPTSLHTLTSKEWASTAAVEAFTDFITVATFNSRGESDCHFRADRHGDWDLDGIVDETGPAFDVQISCTGIPTDMNHDGDTQDADDAPVAGFVTELDWLGKVATHTDACSGPLEGKATRIDWMRFFWLLTTEEGLHPDTVATLWDVANPRSWNPNAVSARDPDSQLRRILNGCGALAIPAECNRQLNHGIWH